MDVYGHAFDLTVKYSICQSFVPKFNICWRSIYAKDFLLLSLSNDIPLRIDQPCRTAPTRGLARLQQNKSAEYPSNILYFQPITVMFANGGILQRP